jgi:hypothetical protein
MKELRKEMEAGAARVEAGAAGAGAHVSSGTTAAAA